MNENLVNKIIDKARTYPACYREGQKLFNALRELDFKLYNKFTDTKADCFYSDDKIPNFWDALTTETYNKGK